MTEHLIPPRMTEAAEVSIDQRLRVYPSCGAPPCGVLLQGSLLPALASSCECRGARPDPSPPDLTRSAVVRCRVAEYEAGIRMGGDALAPNFRAGSPCPKIMGSSQKNRINQEESNDAWSNSGPILPC